MLTELALTPDVFDQQRHGDVPSWREKIRSLGRGLFPPGNPCPTIIADLYDGTWSIELGRAIGRAADPGAENLLKSMRSKLERACVKRPCRGDFPDEEAKWIQEARAFDQDAPLDRIVGTDQSCERADARQCGLSMTGADAFWNGITGVRYPPMELAAQMGLLRPICLHASFVCIASPYIYGSGANDFDFVAALIRQAASRPPGFRNIGRVDIHTEGPAELNERDNRRDHVFRELRMQVPQVRPEVRLYFWPKLLERILLAGDLTRDATGGSTGKTRWGVYLGHVARPASDGPNADPTTWTLLHDSAASNWHHRLYGAPAAPLSGSPHRMPW